MTTYSVSGTMLVVLLLLTGLLLVSLLHRIMKSEDNNLDWWQFISTRGTDGRNYADIDKLGKVIGIFVSSWYIVTLGADGKPDAGVLAVYLGFVGGVAGYSAYLRSQRGATTESTRTGTVSTSTEKSKGE